MSDPTSRDSQNRPDSTQRDTEHPIDRTSTDARGRDYPKTIGDGGLSAQPLPSEARKSSLQLLPRALVTEFTIVKPLPTRGGEADLFIVKRISSDQCFVAKIYREGITVKKDLLNLVAGADPDHVVKVVDHGESDGRFYEVQEYVARGSLVELITKEGPQLEAGLVKDILHELLSAVRHLHEKDITHRDLKPANILVRTRKPLDLVLADFGISSLMNNQSERFSKVYQTISYSAPEADSGLVTPSSDFWSLGMIIAEVVGGAHPYRGLSNEVIRSSKATRPVPLEKIEGPWLKLCQGLLTRNPKMRWGADFTQRWLDGDDTLPEPLLEEVQQSVGLSFAPCRFHGRDYVTPEDLAEAMSRHWETGLKYLEKDFLRKWFANDLPGGQELALYVEDLDQEAGLDGHAKLFRVIRKMNPDLVPTFRELVLTEKNLSILAGDALAEDETAQEILVSLGTGKILNELAGLKQCGRLAKIGKEWSLAQARYGQLRKKAESSGHGQTAQRYQSEPVRLGTLLLGLLDKGFVGELRKQTRGIVTPKAREAAWYSDLGNPKLANPANLLLMQELLEPAEKAAELQREEDRKRLEEEEKQREVERRKKKERIKARAQKVNIGISHALMVVGPVLAGYLMYPHWTSIYKNYNSGFVQAWYMLGAPGIAIFAGFLAAEFWLVITTEKSSGGKTFGGAAQACVFAPLYAGGGGFVLYLIMLLVYSIFDLTKGKDNLLEIGIGVAYAVIWLGIGLIRLVGND